MVTLRNPISRTFSAYNNFVVHSDVNGSFLKHIENEISHLKNGTTPEYRVVGNSLYYENVKRYLDVFGAENVKVIFLEEWQKDLDATLREMLVFLNIPDGEMFTIKKAIHNKTSEKGSGNRVLEFLSINRATAKIFSIAIPSSVRSLIKNRALPKSSHVRIGPERSESELLIEFFGDDVSNLRMLLGRATPWSEFG